MFRVIRDTINVQELVDSVADCHAGAIVTFVGTTRDHNEGREVIGLDYEAYPEMAEKELARLGGEVKKRWHVEGVAIVHRLGPVPIGQASVVIAVAAAHREDAFEACRFVIEEIKKTVPIWKKEIFEGGEIWIGTQSGQRLNPKTRPPNLS
jgi:molybdopterin synthase catalytic subunit